MQREELIEAGVKAALRVHGPDPLVRSVTTVVIDEVEPIIRADEKFQWWSRLGLDADRVKADRADLRAKVKALQAQPFAQVGASGWDSISRAQVIALFDGSSE